MLNWLSRKSDHSRIAVKIYGSIVASARQEPFYALWGVPDTREGRFEMIAMHTAVVMQRLSRLGTAGSALGRTVAETFITDMDDNMREIGIGDLTVPKKVKRAAAALYDRHRDYGAALDANTVDGGSTARLIPLIGAAMSGGDTAALALPELDKTALAHYLEKLSGALAATSDADCLAGNVPLPWPPV